MNVKFNPKISIIKIFTIFFIVLFYAFPAILHIYDKNNLVLFLLRDGGVYETIGAIATLSASILFFTLYKENKKNYIYLILTISLFFLFGEEISWGQKILNYNIPEFFLSHNYQQEVTIHNLRPFQNNTRAMFDWGKYLIIAYFVFVPLLSKIFISFKNLLSYFKIPISSLFIVFLVLLSRELNTIINIIFKIAADKPDVLRVGEIFETSLEIIILYFAFELYYKHKKVRSQKISEQII